MDEIIEKELLEISAASARDNTDNIIAHPEFQEIMKQIQITSNKGDLYCSYCKQWFLGKSHISDNAKSRMLSKLHELGYTVDYKVEKGGRDMVDVFMVYW